jgi:putative ATP-binding cassette transporter
MFLPQTPFLISGTLRDQLLDFGQENTLSDDRLLEVLHDVQLEAVVTRVGGLDVKQDWPSILSPDEQQLLAFARLLLLQPVLAFLDHATSALSEQSRERLYNRLSESDITYISVERQHHGVVEHHDLHLEIEENGAWTLEAVAGSVR